MQLQQLSTKIYEIRGHRVMLDYELSKLYSVPTKSLNLAVKRNLKRFPVDFMFQLTKSEWDSLRFQIETLKTGRGEFSKYTPKAFTEQGIAMLSGILNSDTAIEVNIAIMRAFVLLRQFALSHAELSEKLRQLEEKFHQKFNDINTVIDFLLKKDKQQDEQQNRKRIGYK